MPTRRRARSSSLARALPFSPPSRCSAGGVWLTVVDYGAPPASPHRPPPLPGACSGGQSHDAVLLHDHAAAAVEEEPWIPNPSPWASGRRRRPRSHGSMGRSHGRATNNSTYGRGGLPWMAWSSSWKASSLSCLSTSMFACCNLILG
ncbi:hypothetical protein ACQJBY_057869 [Aegilops geniculata]